MICAGDGVTYVKRESRRARRTSDSHTGQRRQAADEQHHYQRDGGRCRKFMQAVQNSHFPALTSATFILASPCSVLLLNGTGTHDALPIFICGIG